jgi:hypothetical protein
MPADIKSDRNQSFTSQNVAELEPTDLKSLKSVNPLFDFSKAPRCGAKTRRATCCQCPAMPNGRCRLHGGLSTGPLTPEGIERIRRAVTKHGRYTQAAKEQRRQVRNLLREARAHLRDVFELL